ncbi:hypothetical protein [Burkholderia diffusa]|uniref:hypothetical protein n=1 Tax=Burkholderia diffusa TaxID=488732 RepID=UPI0012D99AEA
MTMDARAMMRDARGFLLFFADGRTRAFVGGAWRVDSTRPVPPRYDREADRDRTCGGARRRIIQRIAEAEAAAVVGACGATLGRWRIGFGIACAGDDRVARHVGQALGRMIERHGDEFRKGCARIERHAIRSVK